MRVLSFSTLFFILLSCSICSVISAMASWCFFLRLTRVASCWMWASSRSRRSLVTSASRFLFSSIWAEVAPEASPRRSPMFSSSRAKSDLWRSALARACLSASSVLLSKLDDEQSLVAKIQKGIKENQAHVEELEEELEAERQARAKAERQRSDLARELENMGERLGEASGATSAQIELNKKREAEVTKLRRDLEEAHIQQEATLVSLKKKHQDAIAEMTEQIEQLNKMKNKVEKDKTLIMREIADARAAVDEVNRSKAASEKSHRNLLSTLNDQSKKIEEATLTLNDMEGAKRKIAAENADLLRQLQEMENSANMLSKLKLTLADQLDEARAVADHEAKERQSLLGKFRNAEHEVAGMQDHYQEEISAKEKKAKQFDRIVGEWKGKVDSIGMDLDSAQKE